MSLTTREKLLDSAYAEIYKHGFQGASVDTILANCKITKGSMYHHFKSKKNLALAVIDEILAPKMTRMVDDVDETLSLKDKLFSIIDFIGTVPYLLASGCPLSKLTTEMAPLDDDFKVHLSLIHHTLHYSLQKMVQEGIDNGEIKSLDSNDFATFLIASIWGNISLGEGLVTPESYQRSVQHLKNYIISL